jgi:hypothetical protein
MNRGSFKFYTILALCLIVIHSGIAEALARCLDEDHSASATAQHHHDTQGPNKHSESSDESEPTIHCISVHLQVGPALRASVVELTRSSKGVLLTAGLHPETLSSPFRNDLWLEAVFKRVVTFSLPIDLARHLFLSVFRI